MSVTVSDGRACWGEFNLFVNRDGAAWGRLDEHCEWTPRDPARANEAGEVEGFIDQQTAADFGVPAAEVVTREQLGRALGHWLETGNKAGEFDWG